MDVAAQMDVAAHLVVRWVSRKILGRSSKMAGFGGDGIFGGSGLEPQFAAAADAVVTITGMTQQVTTTTADFFHGAGVAIEKVGADSWVYVDSDHNGNFNPTTDVTIHVVGATVVAGDVLF